MPQVVVLNNSSSADDAEVAYASKAVDAQLREDFCPRWPSVPYQPVTFFRTKEGLPVASGISLICSIVDELDDDSSAAYHSWVGVPFIKIGRRFGDLATLLSHEVLEETVNPTCNETRQLPNGMHAAHEVADPVQSWTYLRDVTIMGQRRVVILAGFVLPSWFTGGPGPHYFCPGIAANLAPGELAPGGYMPVLENGHWVNIFGPDVSEQQQYAKARKHVANETSPGHAAGAVVNDFIASLKRWEGSVPHMYLDTKGLVTVAVGNLLPTASSAMDLPFMFGTKPAFSHEINAEYARVLRMTPGLSAGAYRRKDSPVLLEEDIDRLLSKRLSTEFLPGLLKLFPTFARFPRPAQVALVDIAFNCGIAGLAKFKHLRASVAAGSWIGAGVNSRRAGAREERNAWTRRQFEAAAAPLVS